MAASLSDWLALREAADRAARSSRLTRKLASIIGRQLPLRVVDLGAGTGSNLRYLAGFLPQPQQWLLIDRDPVLLEEARVRGAAGDLVETRALDLGPLDVPEIFSGCHLVTASALLDLVSDRWLHALAAQVAGAGAAALFALTYDGRFECSPPDAGDAAVRTTFNCHQRRNDKGFGLAAGPDATDSAEQAFASAGYHVERENSNWMLEPDAAALQRSLIAGWAAAASEIDPDHRSAIADWSARRLSHVDAGCSRIIVGHQDLIAWRKTPTTEDPEDAEVES